MGKDGRYEKSIRFRLDLNNDEERGMFEWLQGLKALRQMKPTLRLGLELAHAAITKDYDRLAQLLPDFTAHIQSQVQSPANYAFQQVVQYAADTAPTMPQPVAPPIVEDEPVQVVEEDFDMFAEFEL